jgi:hypothetical protein
MAVDNHDVGQNIALHTVVFASCIAGLLIAIPGLQIAWDNAMNLKMHDWATNCQRSKKSTFTSVDICDKFVFIAISV